MHINIQLNLNKCATHESRAVRDAARILWMRGMSRIYIVISRKVSSTAAVCYAYVCVVCRVHIYIKSLCDLLSQHIIIINIAASEQVYTIRVYTVYTVKMFS